MEYRSLTLTNFFLCDKAEFLRRLMLLFSGVIITIIFFFNLLQINDDMIDNGQPASDIESVEAYPAQVVPATPLQEEAPTETNYTPPVSTEPAPAPINSSTKPDINNTQKTTVNTAPQPIEQTPAPQPSWQTLSIEKNDTLEKLLTRFNVNNVTINAIEDLPQVYNHTKALQPDQTIRFLFSPDHKLRKITYSLSGNKQLIIEENNGNFTSKIQDGEFTRKILEANLDVRYSLYAAAKKAHVSPKVIMSLANIFSDDVDFTRNIRLGDSATVLYQEDFKNGNPVRAGNILAAQVTAHGKTYDAIRFTNGRGKTNYYTPTGGSLRHSFERVPVQFKRISSSFNLKRKHPILHISRPHYGVDLAAASGTPIHATSDGRIISIGRKGGYGNAIQIRHNARITTLYGHMSRFAKKLRRGSAVKEGQVIGYVGMTGLATGPHVHYEFRINGKPYNPMRIKLPYAPSIPRIDKPEFTQYAQHMISLLKDT